MLRLVRGGRVWSCALLAVACGSTAGAPNADPEAIETPGLAPLATTASASACGLGQPAFCETFDAPSPVTTRAGQLNSTLWGVSRAIGNNNLGQGQYDAWGTTTLDGCSGSSTVEPENDVIICNGQLREAVNDLHTVTTLAMYPKQPFDFANRTGIVAFDVSNDTLGTHTEWPEFWITDQPVPTPFTFEANWLAAARNAVGLRFSAEAAPGQGAVLAPSCPNDGNAHWSMGSAVAVRNYAVDDQDNGGSIRAQVVGCVTRASGPGHMNHVEIHISQSQIDVYATDADTTSPLKHIAVVSNANLSFTRGLVWLEDAHYNAAKGGGATEHTFSWDNLGFDGPVLPRDLAFDAPDALQNVTSYPGQVNLGWLSQPGSGRSFTVPGVTGASAASAALLTFNFYHYTPPTNLIYVVNGHSHTLAWPYPDNTGYTWRTFGASVPLSDVVSGNNTVNIYGSDQAVVVANVDLIMAGAGGVVSP